MVKSIEISSTEEIADLVKYHHFYQFVADDMRPSDRTLNRFKEEYGLLIRIRITININYS
ncbi:MAG: hypothetical protein LBC39_04645 [Methanobrevibacter sp.]|jgi:hypothetical protein|nr:hypothetical protein [Candidatus Methanovirga aequatorialis]